jgi:cathepsin B
MKSVIVAVVLLQALSVFCMSVNNIVTEYQNTQKIISKVNHNPSSTWIAGVNENFKGVPLTQIKKLLGYKESGHPLKNRVSPRVANLPTNFDSAQNWPKCSTIGTIYNQAECGSCWAFGAVEAISDRFCIASSASFNQILSFMDMVACGPDDGCEGGDPDDAFDYAQQSGLVTGTCYPYNIPTCTPQQQPCLNFVNTPNCVQTCNDSEVWSQSLHYLSNAYDVNNDQNSIMSEIYSNGPVEACFTVYEDFLSYKSGVYQYQSGDALGGHCIKIIGWGVENGTPYWLCNNSWTTYWGWNGQFKILRGQDECGIEDQVVAGTPQV